MQGSGVAGPRDIVRSFVRRLSHQNARAGVVQPGSTIVVQLADDEEVACQVVWLDANDIGLRFYEPLDAKVLARALGEREPEEQRRFDAAANVRLII